MIDIDAFTDAVVANAMKAIRRETAPLLRRIEVLETEMKHGHERIKQLEAMKGGNHD